MPAFQACELAQRGVLPRAPVRGVNRGHAVRTYAMKRKVLVILSNRFQRTAEPRFVEILCQEDGTILKETPLKKRPAKAIYDEVWENDDARHSLDSCKSVKRHYKHALIKVLIAAPAKPAQPAARKPATRRRAKA
jgi:hypothetical protein